MYNRSIQLGLVTFALLIFCIPALPKKRPPVSTIPNQFEIGRLTFFDFGPPMQYYELFIVRMTTSGASIERITLTPAGDECISPAKVESASASITDSAADLLGSTNPCTISEKAMHHELKRRKRGLVFSGANIMMRFPCGTQPRLIRADILDRDMFDPAADTPEHTSWTMKLLERLERAVGPGVMDKPILSIPIKEVASAKPSDSEALKNLSAGGYDALFEGADIPPSLLYRAAQIHPPPPTVHLVSSLPIPPNVSVMPAYPPLARMARIEGFVTFKMGIDLDGDATNPTFESGHPLLLRAVKDAVKDWKFPKEFAHQQIQAVLEFNLNCPKRTQ